MPAFAPGPRPLGLPEEFVWPVRVDVTGRAGPTRMQVRGLGWRRTSRGLYVPATVQQTVRQRIVEAAAALPAYGAVTGWAGLRWLGGRWFDGTDGHAERAVTLALMDSSIREQRGIAISEERLDPSQILPHAGLRVTDAAYAVLFEIRHAATDLAAVVYAAMAAYDDLVSRDELATLVSRSSGWNGIGRGRLAVALMEENFWSPAEVKMWWIWAIDGELPSPLPNRPVFDLQGRHIGTPDLLDAELGIAGEYDSELHLDRVRRRRDVEREDRYRRAGLEPVVMVTGDLTDPWPFLGRLRAAYARAARRPPSDRRWTIDPPPWWTPTFTVEQRRALTGLDRDIWLNYRLQAG